jgi:hypothetical protein
MSDLTIPTDSVLRRHFEQRAMALGLPPVPEDSVLRRHYLQRLETLLEAPARGAGATAPARPLAGPVARAAEPEFEAAVADTGTPHHDEPSSWFGRLLRKLGGG